MLWGAQRLVMSLVLQPVHVSRRHNGSQLGQRCPLRAFISVWRRFLLVMTMREAARAPVGKGRDAAQHPQCKDSPPPPRENHRLAPDVRSTEVEMPLSRM